MSIFQLVYCSRNRISGTRSEIDAAIESILAVSRAKNEAVNVTGALLFNGMAFAQVLEGGIEAVEAIFDAIQCDQRHGDIVLLHNADAPERLFPDWSMAYADRAAVAKLANATVDLEDAFNCREAGGARIVSLLHQLVARDCA